MTHSDELPVPDEESNAYTEALETMEPLEAAAHRTADVIGCAGTLVGIGGGVFAGIAAYRWLGITDRWLITLAIAAGSGVPFLFTALYEGARWRAIRAAKRERMSIGTHAALNAYRGDDEPDGG